MEQIREAKVAAATLLAMTSNAVFVAVFIVAFVVAMAIWSSMLVDWIGQYVI